MFMCAQESESKRERYRERERQRKRERERERMQRRERERVFRYVFRMQLGISDSRSPQGFNAQICSLGGSDLR